MTTDPQNRRGQVREKFLELLKGHPEGRRWSELVEELQKAFPEFPYGTLTGITRLNVLWKECYAKMPDKDRALMPMFVVWFLGITE